MNLHWNVGNRTFVTAIAGAALLGFLAFNDAYPVVNPNWAGILIKIAGAFLGLSVYYLRDALRRVDERLASYEAKIEAKVRTPEVKGES